MIRQNWCDSQISTVARTKFRAQKDAMKIIIPLAGEKGRFSLMLVSQTGSWLIRSIGMDGEGLLRMQCVPLHLTCDPENSPKKG
jgi:hypothetical protein